MHDLNGDWDMSIQFIRGEAQHRLRVEQDGESLTGTYHFQYDTQPLQGSVRGNDVQIQTDVSHERQGVGYRFEGVISGDEMQGSLDLGEYWQAAWTAKRRQ